MAHITFARRTSRNHRPSCLPAPRRPSPLRALAEFLLRGPTTLSSADREPHRHLHLKPERLPRFARQAMERPRLTIWEVPPNSRVTSL